jgi:hypothetical protein
MPSICAAHAFPVACSDAGSVSTNRARSTAWTMIVSAAGLKTNPVVVRTCVDGKVHAIDG